MHRASIVIPVFNRAELTRNCLDGLLTAEESRGCELIVVDDCSQDGTAELLASYGSAIRVIHHAVNTGYGQGVNDGTALASENYIVHLNNDTIPVKGWLNALCRYADDHPQAAVVGSKLLNVDGSVQHAGIVFCSQRRPWHLYRWMAADHPAANKSRRFQAVTSTCLLVRREAFDAVGGFDATYRNSYNDVDFCLRLGELGRGVHYCHDSVLYHLEGASKVRSPAADVNEKRFLERWRGTLREDEWEYYVADGLLQIRRHDDIVEVAVSPNLARVSDSTTHTETEELLLRQSRQIALLLREYISLRLNSTNPQILSMSDRPLLCEEVDQVPSDRVHGELTELAERVLGIDALRAERDALLTQRNDLLARVERFRNSLPGRTYAAFAKLFKRGSR